MKGRSLAAIFASLSYPPSWKNHLDETFKAEFYRHDHDVTMRRDLKTEEQWTKHAYSLSKGEAHVYSYTVGYGGSHSGQPVDPQLHPYMSMLQSNTENGHEIPLTIHGLMPEPGTLAIHVSVHFRDVCNTMKQDVLFFGDSLEQLNVDAANWCEYFLNKCNQRSNNVVTLEMEEIFWNPPKRQTLFLDVPGQMEEIKVARFLKHHFETRAASLPQDANPNVEFKITKRAGGEDEQSSFKVRVVHLKI